MVGGAITPASAEPLLVRRGFVDLNREGGRIQISGDRFTLPGSFDETGGRLDPADCGFEPCLPGDSISLGRRFSGSDFPFHAVVDGIPYQQDLDTTSALIDFSGTAVLPPFGPGETTSISAPFLFTGFLNHISRPDPFIFSGAGIATLNFQKDRSFEPVPVTWTFTDGRYEFEDPALIPEPATLLLTGAGCVVIAVRSRIRRRHRPPFFCR